MIERKTRIVMVQIINRNLGDGVIADCTEYLIRKALPRFHKDDYILYPYNIYSEDYEIIRHADLIIFAGGGIIKYKYEKFYDYIAKILWKAEEFHIPVFFNAVGVEGYAEQDEKCQQLKEALNLDCVKEITVRDDIDTLKEDYIYNKNIVLKSVFDPAVWCKKAYKAKRNSGADIIGLGIVRHRIFSDNGIENIDKEFLLDFWTKIIEYCETKKIRWKVFTNGLKSDEEFAEEVLRYAGYGDVIEECKVKRMNEASELIDTISNFKAIIASRLHANIIAYTLGVPSVAPVWNDKLILWGKRIGKSERFIHPEELNAERVILALESALQERMNPISGKNQRKALRELKRFIRLYGKKANGEDNSSCDWEQKLVATALGGKNYLYCNMNSLETLSDSVEKGFHWLECDVRLTEDDKLVCVNGWNQAIYNKLECYSSDDKQKMKYDDFMKKKYYGKYPVCDYSMFVKAVAEYQDVKIVLDIGKPEKKKMDLFYEQLIENLPSSIEKNIYLRLQRKDDVVLAKQKKIPFALMYYFEQEEIEDIVKFCVEKNISWVTMKKAVFNNELCQRFHDKNIKICVFSADTFEQVHELCGQGADLTAVHYVSPKYLNEMGM